VENPDWRLGPDVPIEARMTLDCVLFDRFLPLSDRPSPGIGFTDRSLQSCTSSRRRPYCHMKAVAKAFVGSNLTEHSLMPACRLPN
jgi:hypothetical protein